MSHKQEPCIIAYIPVLHEGYRIFFTKHPEAKSLYLFGDDITQAFEHLKKDIRRLPPTLIQKSLEAWGLFNRIEILDLEHIEELQHSDTSIIMPDDDISEALQEKYFADRSIEKDSIFLRWDKKTSIEPKQVSPDIEISEEAFDRQMMEVALQEGAKAKDWWRRIGAAAIKDGKRLFQAHNTYVPSDQIANDEGDPRSNFTSGQYFESSLALHAEASMVAQAAKTGVSLKGADVYCDTFPCPPCAKQLAYAGIRRLFYRHGYAVLDGERILKSQGVQIVFVK